LPRFGSGVGADPLRAIDRLPALRTPVLIAVGADDAYTSAAETVRLFDAASAPKELWNVNGAAHVDLRAFDPYAYEPRVATFLLKHLGNPS
jgi:fermentation-respiration switch protein FrsA (DUF1100 family)